jgi:hypothetical protein
MLSQGKPWVVVTAPYLITVQIRKVLLQGIQLTFVQRFQQLQFVIHYCCDNTRKMRAPNAVMRSGAPHMYWPHEK